MRKRDSRVAQEAREAQQRAQEVQRKIKQLSTHIANPQKYFTPKPDERTRSTVERFRRYFALDRITPAVEKRKPTRAEMRSHRSWAITYSIIAFIVLMYVLGQIFKMFGHHV